MSNHVYALDSQRAEIFDLGRMAGDWMELADKEGRVQRASLADVRVVYGAWVLGERLGQRVAEQSGRAHDEPALGAASAELVGRIHAFLSRPGVRLVDEGSSDEWFDCREVGSVYD